MTKWSPTLSVCTFSINKLFLTPNFDVLSLGLLKHWTYDFGPAGLLIFGHGQKKFETNCAWWFPYNLIISRDGTNYWVSKSKSGTLSLNVIEKPPAAAGNPLEVWLLRYHSKSIVSEILGMDAEFFSYRGKIRVT